MPQFIKQGNSFYRKDENGSLYLVSDPDTMKGLGSGQLPYYAIGGNRTLKFADEPATQAPSSTPPVSNSSSGTTDINSLIKEKLLGAINNYKGVDTSTLEQKRQELLRKQLVSSPYSEEGEKTLTGSQKLSLLRDKGSQFEPELKSIEEQILKAKQGDAQSMSNLKDIISVAKDAGLFGAEGGYQSGLGKEYSDYVANEKANGNTKVMSLNEYANMDANRKKSVTNISNTDGGLNPKQVTVFNGIVGKYQNSPLVKAADRTIVVDTVSTELKKDPKNASLQLSFIYSFIQMLDTYQSAVREGEIGIVSGTQGLADKLSNLPDKISQGTLLSTDVINRYISTAKILSDSIKGGANRKKTDYGSQANVAGVGDAWKEYLAGTETTTKSAPVTIKVKRKSDGATGTINIDEYNPALYTKI